MHEATSKNSEYVLEGAASSRALNLQTNSQRSCISPNGERLAAHYNIAEEDLSFAHNTISEKVITPSTQHNTKKEKIMPSTACLSSLHLQNSTASVQVDLTCPN